MQSYKECVNFPGGMNGKKKKKKTTRLPMQETQDTRVRSLGQEDPLEEGNPLHSCTQGCVCTQSLRSCPVFVIPRTVAHLVPLSMEFFKQEYWSGLPLPTPGDLPDSGIEPTSLASLALAGGFFTSLPPGKP